MYFYTIMINHIVKLLSFTHSMRNNAKVSIVKIDLGGGNTKTAEHFAPVGDDSYPLTTDYPVVAPTQGTGRHAVVGYVDPINEPKAQQGDKRVYARDFDTGAVVVDVWLKNDGSAITENENGKSELLPDGSIKGSNGSGSFELQASGDFVVNGVTIKPNGQVIIPKSLLLADKEINGHKHPIAWTDPAGSGTSGGNI